LLKNYPVVKTRNKLTSLNELVSDVSDTRGSNLKLVELSGIELGGIPSLTKVSGLAA